MHTICHQLSARPVWNTIVTYLPALYLNILVLLVSLEVILVLDPRLKLEVIIGSSIIATKADERCRERVRNALYKIDEEQVETILAKDLGAN